MRTAIAFALLLTAAAAQAATPPIGFNRNGRPILSDRCFSCHGPDSASRKSPLRLDREESARPALARILQRISSADPAVRMPPAYLGRDPLPVAEIGILRQWIEEGGKY